MFPKFFGKQETLASPSYTPSFGFLHLMLLLKIHALEQLEAPENWRVGAGLYRVRCPGPAPSVLRLQDLRGALRWTPCDPFISPHNTRSYQQMAL